MNIKIQLFILLIFHSLLGSVCALSISASQLSIDEYEGSSVVLSTSYSLTNPKDVLRIKWELDGTSPTTLGVCTKKENSTSHFPSSGYERRMRVVPENGSLIINRLQKKDSGKYRVTIYDASQSDSVTITVTVLESDFQDFNTTMTPQTSFVCFCPSNITNISKSSLAWIFLGTRLSSVFILLAFVFCSFYFRQKIKTSKTRGRHY
ncbi:transmembrane and immunoglobulin domain-containing 1-like [Pelobates cultripes]|nr:transmembrane and immunoglobulin domain-containing 1-like [Pelobates cultripes]